jgi:hypothetical protein
MKNSLPYLLGIAAILIIGSLIVTSKNSAAKKMDERVTLRSRDKIPYGTAVARTLLPALFPNASISADNKAPGNWDSIHLYSENTAVILVGRDFNPDEDELRALLRYAENGNYVFIIAKTFSSEAVNLFGFDYNRYEYESSYFEDSLRLQLVSDASKTYVYPGKKFESPLFSLDTVRTRVVGSIEKSRPNFLRFKAGRGGIFIHSSPLAFSNYFILHKDNINYYQHALSVIPPEVKAIDWNEYYISKPQGLPRDKKPDWFGALMQYPSFRYGMITAMAFLFLSIILGMRRRQRMIPAYKKPSNDSLDFVKTLGRLYHDRGDHANLARKLAVYFLDHVRLHYKLATHTLDEGFTNSLHDKSGFGKKEIEEIVSFIISLQSDREVSDQQLADFHRQLELFYQNT